MTASPPDSPKTRLFGQLMAVGDMIRFRHSIFALPWALAAAMYAAKGWPVGEKIAWIVVAMVAARSAAMAFNRIADARLDAENPRTRDRAIPAGRVSMGFAATFAAAAIVVFVLAAWRLNTMCLKLSPVAIVVILGYSYTKRFTALCHGFVGLSLAIAPMGAWLAVRPEWAPLPLLLSTAVLFWMAGGDILYACEDLEFDRAHGLHSAPAALGLRGAMIASIICHAAAVGALAAAGIHYATVGVVAALLAYAHMIVKPSDLKRLNRAFFHVNAAVSLVILAGAALDVFAGR